jgi:hypothetical protein
MSAVVSHVTATGPADRRRKRPASDEPLSKVKTASGMGRTPRQRADSANIPVLLRACAPQDVPLVARRQQSHSRICAVMTPHLADLWLSGTTEVWGSGLAISHTQRHAKRNYPN